MKQVILPAKISWTILSLGTLIAVFLVWKAYDTISYLTEVQEDLAIYHQVSR